MDYDLIFCTKLKHKEDKIKLILIIHWEVYHRWDELKHNALFYDDSMKDFVKKVNDHMSTDMLRSSWRIMINTALL